MFANYKSEHPDHQGTLCKGSRKLSSKLTIFRYVSSPTSTSRLLTWWTSLLAIFLNLLRRNVFHKMECSRSSSTKKSFWTVWIPRRIQSLIFLFTSKVNKTEISKSWRPENGFLYRRFVLFLLTKWSRLKRITSFRMNSCWWVLTRKISKQSRVSTNKTT